MTRTSKLLTLTAALALGALTWVWLQPRTARDCVPQDHDCLRRVAERLIAESMALDRPGYGHGEIELAGRLLATEGTIDLATLRNRLPRMGLPSHIVPTVVAAYFNALTDPTFPFDIAKTIRSDRGPQDSDPATYLTAAFRITLADPARSTAALDLWRRNLEDFREFYDKTGSTSFHILSWLSLHDPAEAAAAFLSINESGRFKIDRAIHGPGDWSVFFRLAAFHCSEGRVDDGRTLLRALKTNMGPRYIAYVVPALLICEGEDATVADVEAALGLWVSNTRDVMQSDLKRTDGLIHALEFVSGELRHGFADWLLQDGRESEVAAYWSKYGAVQIATRHLPSLDWLPSRMEENQATSVPERPRLNLESETIANRLEYWATAESNELPLTYAHPSPLRDIASEWPSPKSIAAARGLVHHSNGSPLVTAFIVGLERQLGCAPSDATMQTLLDDISTLKAPLDEARAIIELLRFTPPPVTDTTTAAHDCIVE